MEGKIWPILGALLLALAGCIGPFTRSGSKDVDKDLDVPIVADFTDPQRENDINGALVQISGAGLVTGLHGTGDAPPGLARQDIETELRKQKVERFRELLDSKDNAVVCVSAVLHGGMRKWEPVDVEISLPPGSRATSLVGGTLQKCSLKQYQIVRAGQFDASAVDFRRLSGDVLAQAAGPLLVGMPESGQAAQLRAVEVVIDQAAPSPPDLRRARIWEGGVVLADRPFVFVMKPSEKTARAASAVADRLNGLFREDVEKIRLQNERFRQQNDVAQRLNQKFDGGRGEIAKAFPNSIALNVPFAYCLNPERYLRVAHLVPVRETPEQQLRYRQKLAQILQDPKDAVRAALRLEALGQESIPVLKSGLDSPQPLVRFASAEALTYLGSTAGVDELAKAAQNHRQLRSWALLALANLNESVCRERLTELLDQPEAELSYGAFFALRLLCRSEARDREDYLGGRWCGRFWLHHVALTRPAMIHLNLTKREEIVLFGRDIRLQTPGGISAGTEFTITPLDGKCCQVSRVRVGEDSDQLQATLRIDDILWKLAQLGGQYTDAVDFLLKASQRGALNCPLAVDALPTPMGIDDLAKAGRDANFLRQ